MTSVKILIQKKDMPGDLALFAPAVARGATVCFSSDVKGCNVEFPNNSPFESPGQVNPGNPVTRSVPPDAARGIYQFKVEHGGDVSYLQLAVESDGVPNVGFSVENDGGRSEIHTQLPVPKGRVTIYFNKNVVNEGATLSVCHSDGKAAQPPITIPIGSTHKRSKPLELEDKLSVRLDPSPKVFGQESGGTRIVDIIVGP